MICEIFNNENVEMLSKYCDFVIFPGGKMEAEEDWSVDISA